MIARDSEPRLKSLAKQGRKTLNIVEVKAGQTISSDWAASSLKITELFAKTKQAASSVVVYGGTEKQERNGVTYLPWHAFLGRMSRVTTPFAWHMQGQL
jgi:hypothetical protein